MLQKTRDLLDKNMPLWAKEMIPKTWRTRFNSYVYEKNSTPDIKEFIAQNLVHPLEFPEGETAESLYAYLASFYFENEGPTPALATYLEVAFNRFIYTLQLVPKQKGRLLEIGASPYFASLLLRRFTGYELFFLNFFHDMPDKKGVQMMANGKGERISFPYENVNIEVEPLPYPDNHFDVVLLCEVLEHFTNDTFKVLLNIKRVLKPDGYLVLTTPNVARLENVALLLSGQNIFHPYSGYGPYGRHNREYNFHELYHLLKHVGFTVEERFTSDIHENRAHIYFDLSQFIHLVEFRKPDLGDYMFVRAKNDKPAKPKKPNWLYVAYPPDELSD